MSEYFFTSESVSEGHPDKLADQVSDSILDAILAQDPTARVAAETLANTGLVVLAGEITTTANVDYIKVARDAIKRIGGTLPEQIPPAEHIKEVKKRLKNATPKLELDEREAGGLLGERPKKSGSAKS